MTIAQRIELRRLGYSKDEIAELAELEKTPEPVQAEPEPVQEQEHEQVVIPEVINQQPDMNAQLLTAITNLTAVLQSQKLNNTAQPQDIRKETTDDIFNNILKG